MEDISAARVHDDSPVLEGRDLEVTETSNPKRSPLNWNQIEIPHEAKDATHVEKEMTVRQAFSTYPKAVTFSVILSTAIIMEGYYIVLLASLFASPSFTKKYGTSTGDYTHPLQIPPQWQARLFNGAYVGDILGLFINGIVSERFGNRKTMIVSLVAITASVFSLFFARKLVQLLVGEILCGIPWGVFQILTTAYASELCPTQLRAYLTTYVNLCWVIGVLIRAGVLRSLVYRSDQ